MNFNQAISIIQENLLPIISDLYDLEDYDMRPVEGHYGGRNVIFTCEKLKSESRIIRIAFLPDRSREDFLAELEYIRFLHNNGASVSNVIDSVNGRILEEVRWAEHTFFVSLFDKARGKMLAENNYCYREGVPITEYFYNCGKVLGKIHQLSKEYIPTHRRYSFFDKFTVEYIQTLLPDSLSLLKQSMAGILEELKEIPQDIDSYGMIHFDYSDGNYHIDFDNGQITVYDFDNTCFGWYMYDLAELWTHGVGWIQFEKDADKRRRFMEEYFSTILDGYRSETKLDDSMLDKLPLFIQATILENIVDEFETLRNNNEEPDLFDKEWLYLTKCLNDNILFKGFFHEIYSCSTPFEYEDVAEIN